MALILNVKSFTIFATIQSCVCVCTYFPSLLAFFAFHSLFYYYTKYLKEALFLEINYVQKKNHKIIFLVIISFMLNKFKALVNQTFAKHSLWICQASVLTSQISSRVIKLFAQVYWLYSCP